MKNSILTVFVIGLIGTVGCGEGDPNKNLKPLDDKSKAPLKPAGGGGEGNSKTSMN